MKLIKDKPNMWMPKKAPKIVNQFGFHIGLLDKYSKAIPKTKPIELTYVSGTPAVPSYNMDTRKLIP